MAWTKVNPTTGSWSKQNPTSGSWGDVNPTTGLWDTQSFSTDVSLLWDDDDDTWDNVNDTWDGVLDGSYSKVSPTTSDWNKLIVTT